MNGIPGYDQLSAIAHQRSMTAIVENKYLPLLEEILEKTFDPKSKEMRAIKEALSNSTIASLFFNVPGGKNVVSETDPSKKDRKVRGPIQAKQDQDRCQAFIYAFEKDTETGEWKPKRCTRGHEKDTHFCKLHGAPDGKKNEDDSKHAGEDVIHEFKWGRFGCVETGPTYVFEKFRDELIKAANKSEESLLSDHSGQSEKPAKKQRASKKKDSPKDKPKRTMNAYMIYLQEKRQEIKQCLLEQTPELKGKELANKVTETAGAAWNASSEEEKKPYLEKAAALKTGATHEMPPAIEEDECCGGHSEEEVSEHEAEPEAEDTMTLRHDEKLGVWIDDETNLYYGTDNMEEPPLGQIQKDKLMPFKKSK